MPTCSKCGKSDPEVTFGTRTQNGKTYPRPWCVDCTKPHERQRGERRRANGQGRYPQSDRRRYERHKARRAAGMDRAKYIVQDARRSDRKRGLDNNLTQEWVAQLISAGCECCGETHLQMTIDRIDNSKGHVVGNVVPSCIRCNLLRRDMPYDAWMALVDAVRAARVAGLFGTWTGKIHRTVAELADAVA